MVEFLKGISLQPFISLGNVITSTIVLLGVWWIRGIPERMREANATRAINNAEAETLRREMNDLNLERRKDIHDQRGRIATLEAKQFQSEKELLEAARVQRQDRADMDHMMFCIQCLIDEVKRLDPDPVNNRSIQQAEAVLLHMSRKGDVPAAPKVNDPAKSDELNAAEHTQIDTAAADKSAIAACDAVKRSERKRK